MRRYFAEGIGTFGVVMAGCGALAFGSARLGMVGVACAFGVALAAMTVALARVSGGQFNPAVTVAMAMTGRLPWRDVGPYIAAQLAGGTAGAGVVVAIAMGRPGASPLFAESLANGYGRMSPGYYGLGSAIVAEVALTSLLVLVTLGASRRTPLAHAAGAGLAYTLVHLVGMPVTGLAANPARALGPALLAGGPALAQVWVFVFAPLAGAMLAGLAHRILHGASAADRHLLVADTAYRDPVCTPARAAKRPTSPP